MAHEVVADFHGRAREHQKMEEEEDYSRLRTGMYLAGHATLHAWLITQSGAVGLGRSHVLHGMHPGSYIGPRESGTGRSTLDEGLRIQSAGPHVAACVLILRLIPYRPPTCCYTPKAALGKKPTLYLRGDCEYILKSLSVGARNGCSHTSMNECKTRQMAWC